MTNKKSTKRALWMSVLSLVLCVAMLAGTTFAWFTDSVSSKNNIITAGNLDVELEFKKVVNGVLSTEWETVGGRDDIFDPNAYWEPGRVEVVYLKVSNLGSLALKYQLGVNVVKDNPGTNVDGKEFRLSEHLVFKTVLIEEQDVGSYNTRESVVEDGDVLGFKDYNGKTTPLEAKSDDPAVNDEDFVALIVYMPESVGNVANHKKSDDPLNPSKYAASIEFGINLFATQYTVEDDSYGNDYDDDAWVEGFKVTTANDLQAALNNGETNIVLMNDIELTESIVIPAPTTTTYSLRTTSTVIDLNGKTVTGVGLDAEGKRTHLIVNNGNAIIENGKIKVTGTNGGSAIYNNEDANLVVENIAITGAPKSGGNWPSYAINSYGTLTVEDLTVTSNHGAICLYGDSVINNATVTMNGMGGSSHVFYIGGDGTDVVINDGTYTHNGNADGSLAYIMTGATVTVNGGTFSASNGGYGMATYTGALIVNGGTFANAFLDWGGPITISGGTFATKPADKHIAEDYAAVQNADGTWSVIFPQDSFNELIKNAGENATIEVPTGTYTFPASKLQAGQTLNCAPGTVFEGTSSLDIKGATVIGATFSNEGGKAVSGTINGTFKDCVFEGEEALRWCYSDAGETVVFENCVIKTDFRGVHFDQMNGDVIFRNCKINGFNAFGGTGSVTFEDCTFGYDESYYNGLNMYVNTTLIDCKFEYRSNKSNFIDFEAAGKNLAITNCTATLNGEPMNILDVVGGTNKNQTAIIVDGVRIAMNTEMLQTAIKNGVANITLTTGTYTMPTGTNKNVTITGTKDAKINLPFKGVYASGNVITFDGVTIKGETDGSYYSELFNGATKVVYKNCDIYDQLTTYCNSEFINCNFYNTFDNDYSVYCYSGKEIKFDGCSFDTKCSKAIKVYDEGNGGRKVYINDCTFTTETANKAAVEIDSRKSTYYIYFTGNNVLNGAYTKLWNSDPGEDQGTNVFINGDDVINTIQIGTLQELLDFANDVNVNGNSYSGKTVVLTADIDLGNMEWTPIGQTGGNGVATDFKGRFDGQGHTISNLKITNNAYDEGEHYAAGFFGFVDAGDANIVNLTIDGANVNGHHWTGVIAGYLTGNISGCTVKNAIVNCTHANGEACGDKAGVIVGYVNSGSVTGNTAQDCTVTAGRDAGQIAGCAKAEYVHDNTVTNVSVAATGDCTGANIRNEEIGRLN